MTNTVTIEPTTTSAARFRYIGRDFELSWAPAVPHEERVVRDNGDLILELQDLWDLDAIRNSPDLSWVTPGCSFGEFIDVGALDTWADGWSFDLGDINPFDALFQLIFEFLLPSIKELPDQGRLHRDVQAVRSGKRDPKSLPAYTLQVNGAVVRHFLVDKFDGPFRSDAELVAAIQRRSVS